MPGTSQIRWNTFFSSLSSLIRLITNFLLFVGIARLYGAEAFGQFTTAHTLSTLFILFADFGFDVLLATEIARRREQAPLLAQQYLSLKFVFCLVATAAMCVMPSLQHFSRDTQTLIYIFGFYVFFSSLNNFFFALFKGFEQLHHETKISFTINILLLCLLVVFGLSHVPIYFIAWFFVGSRILGLLLAYYTAAKVVSRNMFHLSFSGWKEIMPQILVFGFHSIFGNLFFQMDTILLSFWKSDYDVGIYQSVFKIVILALIMQDVLTNTLTPVLSRLSREDKEKWKVLGRLLYKTLLFIALPICMVLFVYADHIVDILYGVEKYREAISILRIFSTIVLVRYWTEAYALMLTTSQRQKTRMVIALAATLMNYLINAYMIPRYGAFGAALTSLITNIFVGIGFLLSTRLFFSARVFEIRKVGLVTLALILSAVLWNLRASSLWVAAPLAVSICVFASFYIGYTKEERMLVFAVGKHMSIS